MRVTLSHITAAYHWLMTPMDGRGLTELDRRSTLGSCPSRIRELAMFDLSDYEVEGVQTELLSSDAAARPARSEFLYHIASGEFPAGAFVALNAGFQLASPELCFWQMGKLLPLGELVKFGDALCGCYSFSRDSDGRLVKRRTPLTNVEKLASFVHRMGSQRNNLMAYRALKYIVEQSDSPRETDTTILLCLKRQFGGFGMPLPTMRHVVLLDEIGQELLGQESCRCDMYWPSANYDLEYDSDQEHGPNRATHDSLRRSAIRHMGIKVGELRWAQLGDARKFEMSAHLIADEIGFRFRKRDDDLEYRYYQAYLDLRRQLFWQERIACGEGKSVLRIGELDW